MSNNVVDQAYRQAILKVLSEGEPYESSQLWLKVGGFVSYEDFVNKHIPILLDKKMIREKEIELGDDCDGQDITVKGMIYWIPYFEETINKKQVAKAMAKPYVEQLMTYCKNTIADIERDFP